MGQSQYYPVPDTGVGGTVNAITLATGQGLTSLTNGDLFFFTATSGNNTGPVTLDVDGIGAVSLRRSDGIGGSEDLEVADIPGNAPVLALYGSHFSEFYYIPVHLGSAARRNVGLSAGDVPFLESGGVLDDSVIPAGIARDSEIEDWAKTGNVDAVPEPKIPAVHRPRLGGRGFVHWARPRPAARLRSRGGAARTRSTWTRASTRHR